jgi:nucleotide-binding universal stress UspA family protein
MTIVVPYDGTDLSVAALERATDCITPFGPGLQVITIIPNGNESYARERGWIEDRESFDAETIVSRLSAEIEEIAPNCEFEYEVVGQYPQAGMIASKIRSHARHADADLVVIGSDNAGRIVSSVSSVGRSVATDDAYDVLIVRHTGGETE